MVSDAAPMRGEGAREAFQTETLRLRGRGTPWRVVPVGTGIAAARGRDLTACRRSCTRLLDANASELAQTSSLS